MINNDAKEITAVLLTASKKFYVGMHSGFYQMIWFKPGMMIDTVDLCVLMSY